MINRRSFFIVLTIAVIGLRPALADSGVADSGVIVFAAASTTPAIETVIKRYHAKGLGPVTPVFAASSALARQIENGAPADIFISAHIKWMDHLATRDFLASGTHRDLLANRLILIAPADRTQEKIIKLTIEPSFPLADAIGNGRIALGDPDHVPVGLYARAALEKLGVWQHVEDKIVRTHNVRAALALVERGEAVAGIVYASDAANNQKVRIIGTFPRDSHPPINYRVAVIKGHGGQNVKRFVDFLTSDEALEIFIRYGFRPPSDQKVN